VNTFEKKEFLLHKAHCEFDNGDFDKSILDLKQGLEMYESDPELLYYLGLSYYATGDKYKEALNTFKMSLTNMPKEDAGV
jgi:tetratricopeptide (TPR) repeat protein